MKNIFLKETDQKSKLYRNLLTDKLFILEDKVTDVSECNREYQLIYITNNEPIKEGVYGIVNGQVGKVIITHDGYEFQIGKNVSHLYGDFYSLNNVCKKIVLTNDTSLIEDGVQQVSSSFLSFYAENPVDYVEIFETKVYNETLQDYAGSLYSYKFPPKENKEQSSKTEENIIDNWLEKNGNPEIMKQVEREAEELELDNYINDLLEDYDDIDKARYGLLIRAGAKWKAERMYSEEEVLHLLLNLPNYGNNLYKDQYINQWFKNYKK